jgi:hypothetical protein
MEIGLARKKLLYNKLFSPSSYSVSTARSFIPSSVTTTSRSYHRQRYCSAKKPIFVSPLIPSSSRLFSSTAMAKFPTPSLDPPKHEMAYFPQMTTSLPSQSAEFRRVLWTGLYSQLVLMTVPPNGEIGDEVSRRKKTTLDCHLLSYF